MQKTVTGMLRGLTAAAILLIVTMRVRADDRWVRVSTPHFVLYTQTTNDQATGVLRRLETARDFFLQSNLASAVPETRVRIVAFLNEQAYAPYRASPAAFAYYQRTRNQDYIAIQQLGGNSGHVALHEYTHCVLKHAHLDLPLALAEGLAEVYSSIEADSDQFVFGAALPEHVRTLTSVHSFDVQSMLAIDRNSPYYRQPEKMWDFYARSWALSHMLLLGHRYAPHFSEFMAGLAEGQPAENVLRAVYGQDFAMLDRDLKIYVDEGGFRSTSCARVNPPRAPGPFKSRPASDAELNVILADLVSVHSPQYAGLEAKLQSISQASVPNPAVEEALGYLALWKGRLDQARLYFASAVNHGLKNGDTILRYAELEQSSGASSNQILAILRRAVASNPNNDTARLKLGWTAAKMKDYALAISALSEIKIVLPQQAFVILYTLAYSYAKSDRLDECMEVGIRARQNAKTITEQRQLEQLLRYADWKRAARLSTPLLASSDTRVNALSPRASASAAPSADFGRAKP